MLWALASPLRKRLEPWTLKSFCSERNPFLTAAWSYFGVQQVVTELDLSVVIFTFCHLSAQVSFFGNSCIPTLNPIRRCQSSKQPIRSLFGGWNLKFLNVVPLPTERSCNSVGNLIPQNGRKPSIYSTLLIIIGTHCRILIERKAALLLS